MEDNDNKIRIQLNIIFNSIDNLKNLLSTREQAYTVSKQIERYLYNALFYFFFSK